MTNSTGRVIPATLFCLLLLITYPGSAIAQVSAVSTDQWINTLTVRSDLEFLASDQLKGRMTPGAGLDSAAAYIARSFQTAGLKPLGNTYYQELAYCRYFLGDSNALNISREGGFRSFRPGNDFMPYAFTGAGRIEGDVVFAGYGISAPEYDYDDYEGLDVKGRIVVIMRMEPGQANQTSESFKGSDLTWHATIRMKEYEARKRGALALLVITDPLRFLPFVPNRFSNSQTIELAVRDLRPEGHCSRPQEMIPVVQVGDSVVASLFGSFNAFQILQTSMEQHGLPNSFLLQDKRIKLTIEVNTTPIGGRNVIACFPGSDPILKNEAMIVGAHYDHLGVNKQVAPGADSIYNGADDNASGTAALLAVARAFGNGQISTKRTVIFIAFAGEEQGLRGSNTYIKNPSWPLNKTVAMLNLDMVSRNEPAMIYLIGSKENPKLAGIARKYFEATGFRQNERATKSVSGTSDHLPFIRNGIPALFFFTGYHRDYHRVTDDVSLVDIDKCTRVARLVYHTSWSIANDHRQYPIRKSRSDENGYW